MVSPKLVVIPIAVTVGLFVIFYGGETISQLTIENKTAKIPPAQNSYIKEYSLPAGTAPNAILADDNGIVWIIGTNSVLVKFDSKKEQIESLYKIKDSETKQGPLMAWVILKDKDGFLWFSRLGESKLWRFDPQTEEFRTFPTSASAFQMKMDQSTGDIWFVTLGGNTAGALQNTNQNDTEYKISEFWLGNNTTPTGLYVKNDKLWVAKLSSSNEHGGAGKLSEYAILRNENGIITNVTETSGIPYLVFEPTDVFVINDTVWFSEHGSSAIAKYDKTTKNLKRFPTSQNQYQTKTLPLWLKETDGTGFWFNEHGGNRIGFFNMTSIAMTEYEIPSKPSDGYVVYPLDLSVDPQQNKLWFSEWNTDKIGVVDGSVPVPFDIETDKKEILRADNKPSQTDTVQVTVLSKQNTDDTAIFLNATTSWNLLGMDYIRADLIPNMMHLKDGNTAEMTIRHSVFATLNYTVSMSASDKTITRTTFVELNN